MSKTERSPEIPRTVPKLEAELIRDAYERTRRGERTGLGERNETDDTVLSETERRDFYRRILDAGVSSETLSKLGFDVDEEESVVRR
ncbi:hypothetical protein [Haladaptatus sp. NG-WS-4]